MAYGPFNPAGGGGSSVIAETLGLYIDNDGYLCQRGEQEENNNNG